MSEMIERVARAICDSMGHDRYDGLAEIGGQGYEKYTYRQHAIAAIEAMREPTDQMQNGARDWAVAKYGIGIGFDASDGCWKAMIVSALSQANGEDKP